jgi:hypothetical protein
MFCTGSDLAYLYALLGGRGFVRYIVPRDEDVMRSIVDTGLAWWQRHVIEGVEPERTTTVPLEVVKRLRREPNKVTEFDETTTKLVVAWEHAKSAKRDSEKRVDQLQAEILHRLKDAEAARMTDGRVFTFQEQRRSGYTVESGTMRVARVKKG